jgi:hypothetical protein
MWIFRQDNGLAFRWSQVWSPNRSGSVHKPRGSGMRSVCEVFNEAAYDCDRMILKVVAYFKARSQHWSGRANEIYEKLVSGS